jgi:hypothetical protein
MINIDGRQFTVPDVYGTTEVINLGGTTLPGFNTLLIVGSARSGVPFNATGLTGADVIKAYTSVIEAKKFFGKSPLTDAMSYAKAGGAGVVYLLNAASLTRLAATIKDNVTTPADTMKLVPKKYGAAENDISLTIATASTVLTFTIIPPKNTKFLTANASTSSKNITLENVDGLEVGQTVLIASNGVSSPQSTTIAALNTTTRTITLADLPTSAFATSDYARIFQEDTDNQEIKVFDNTVAKIEDAINWINSGKILTATRETYAGILPTTLAKTYLQNVASATKATSPVATEAASGDFDNVASSIPKLFEEFTNYTGSRVRIVVPISSSATVHAVYRALAATLRGPDNQASIQVVVGPALGDILLAESNAAHPIKRAKALNSKDIIMVGCGIDDKAAYLSSSPMFAGMMSANSVRRNFTRDVISATKVEKFFGQSNKETETKNYLAAGVLVFGTGKNGFYIVQGINTYQNHATIWNSTDKASYLIQQIQIVDYVYEGYKEQMDVGVGNDDFDITSAIALGNKVLSKYVRDGYLQGGAYAPKIINAYREGNAIITEPQVTPIEATDFVGFILRVVIPN